MKSKILLFSIVSLFTLTCCSNQETNISYIFKYWNECTVLTNLTNYVKDIVNPNSQNYIPKQDRIATFDLDGTLFGERSPIYVEWMFYQDYFDNYYEGDKDRSLTYQIDGGYRNITLREVYNEINAFRTGEENPNLEMDEAHAGAVLFSGLSINQYKEKVANYIEKDAECFDNLKIKNMYYLPMKEIVTYLQRNEFTTYICSGTDRFMCRTIACEVFNIPTNQVIGMDVSLYSNDQHQVIRGDKLIYKNVKDVKAQLILQEIGKQPVLSFGNSSGDIKMHRIALTGNRYKSMAFMVVADDTTRERGYTSEELEKRTKDWGDFSLISMKNNWKAIYGDNVTLKNDL
ncbi:MAG: hypothetical protein MJ225_04455 [Bacilli bacterium]|nr:hypothetical protein [Bacilli bacterium]